MNKMTKAEAEKFISENGALELLIALGVWTPEPEPVVEKTAVEIASDAISRLPSRLRPADAIVTTIESAGLTLIKASDELVAVRNVMAPSIEDYQAVSRVERLGYIIAKRAGS